MGFVAAGASGASNASPWKTYTGALDGASVGLLTNMARYDGTRGPALTGVMLTDTLGLVAAVQDTSGGAGGEYVPYILIRGFTVNGTAVAPATLTTYTPPSSVRYTQATLVRVNNTQAIVFTEYSAVTGDVRMQGNLITLDAAGNVSSIGAPVQAATTFTATGSYAPFLLSPNKVVSPALTPAVWDVAGSALSVSYPWGGGTWWPWGISSSAWEAGRIDDTHLFWRTTESGTHSWRTLSLIGGAPTTISSLAVSGSGNAGGHRVNANKVIVSQWNGADYYYYKITVSPTYGLTETYYAHRDNGQGFACSPDGEVLLATTGTTANTIKVSCVSDDTGDLVASAAVNAVTGLSSCQGGYISPFVTSTTKALLVYADGGAASVKILCAT